MKYRRCVNEHHNPYKLSQITTIKPEHVSAKLTSREDTINFLHSQETTMTASSQVAEIPIFLLHHAQHTWDLPNPRPARDITTKTRYHLPPLPAHPNLTPSRQLTTAWLLTSPHHTPESKTIYTPISRPRRIGPSEFSAELAMQIQAASTGDSAARSPPVACMHACMSARLRPAHIARPVKPRHASAERTLFRSRANRERGGVSAPDPCCRGLACHVLPAMVDGVTHGGSKREVVGFFFEVSVVRLAGVWGR
jgi:hypothetical protein